MDFSSIFSYIIQAIIGLALGIIGYFLKDLKNTVLKEIDKNAVAAKENKDDIENLRKEFNDYKESVPYKFVLHEEFNRVVGNFDRKLDKIMDKLSGK